MCMCYSTTTSKYNRKKEKEKKATLGKARVGFTFRSTSIFQRARKEAFDRWQCKRLQLKAEANPSLCAPSIRKTTFLQINEQKFQIRDQIIAHSFRPQFFTGDPFVHQAILSCTNQPTNVSILLASQSTISDILN